jgi:hypothetical protein
MLVTVSNSKDCHVQTRFEHFLVSLPFYLTVGNPELILVRCLGPGNKEREPLVSEYMSNKLKEALQWDLSVKNMDHVHAVVWEYSRTCLK